MPRVDIAQRRRRLALRQALHPGARAADPVEATRRVVALHATDPATVYLAAWARTRDVTPAAISDELYERRTLVRMLGMRRTMFVVPADLRAVIEVSTMPRIASAQRRLLVKHLSDLTAIRDPGPWLEDVERSVLRALAARGGTATAEQLCHDEPRLRTQLLMAQGKPYQATQNVTSRVLLLLGAQGHIVRGSPTGSLLSQRYRWALAEQWLPPVRETPPPGQARAELARRWLRAFGPAPLADLRWWTGWTAAEVKQAVADLHGCEVDLDAAAGVALPSDVERADLDGSSPDGPWAALLPALDPTVMGWSDRGWFLGGHERFLFDRSGNAGPTVWLDGRVVGGWAQRRDGEIAVRLLEDVGADAAALVDAEAARLRRWLGALRVTPRFRTPLERELSA
jgi:DNA glycosylase AlkZ-like